MKIVIKIFLILLLLVTVIGGIAFAIGYTYYSQALKEKPLLSRIEELTCQEHYTPFEELPETYINAVIAVEDRRFYEHGAIDLKILFLLKTRMLFVN